MNQPLGDSPLVSIVTPSFNQGRFIAATIESVLAQDYTNIQYLVVDGASTDETLKVLRSYGDRISWISEPDRSQSNAINKGFSLAQGTILAWLNSDDVLLPGAVSRIVAEFKRDEEIGLVYGASQLIDERGNYMGEALSLEPDLWTMLHVVDHVPQPSAFFRRDSLERVGPIDESLRYCMDYELFIRLFVDGPVQRVPFVLSQSRIYDSTISLTGGLDRYREIVAMVRRHSGVTVPPAVANYALDWAEHTAQRLLRRVGSGLTIARVQRIVERATAIGYRQILTRSNPKWQDGWVGREARFLVRKADGDFLEISGEVPRLDDEALEQTLEILVDEVRVDRVTLPIGPFELVYALSPSTVLGGSGDQLRASGHVHEVRIRASWGRIVEHACDGVLSRDRRRLSWRADVVAARRSAPPLRNPVPGWYEDGWAAPLVSVIAYEPGGSITITGYLPDEFRAIRGQRLRIDIGGSRVYDEQLDVGDFHLTFASPNPRVCIVHLSASLWFDPHRDNPDDGPRRISYLLRSVGNVNHPT